MRGLLDLLTGIGDKAGSVGALVSAMGCAMCFPAIASLGAALGLGFLSQWEGLFITTLLPLYCLAGTGDQRPGLVQPPTMATQLIGRIGTAAIAVVPLSPVSIRLEHLPHVLGTGLNGCGITVGPVVAGQQAL